MGWWPAKPAGGAGSVGREGRNQVALHRHL